MEMRIQQIFQRLQDLFNDQSKKSAIDLDLMLDYTRVLYADLLEMRSNTPDGPAGIVENVSPETREGGGTFHPVPVEAKPAAAPFNKEIKDNIKNPFSSVDNIPVAGNPAEQQDDEAAIIEELKQEAVSAISFEPPPASAVPEPELIKNTLAEEAPVKPAAEPMIKHREDYLSPARDVRSVIGINDKFLFLNELFNNHKTEYESALDEINRLKDYEAAGKWLRAKSASKTIWDEESATVQNFIAVLKKHFSVIR